MRLRAHSPFLPILTIVLAASAAACGGGEVVNSVGRPNAQPPAAVAPDHAARYGSADAAEHALAPASSPTIYGSADSLEAAATNGPKTWPTNGQLAKAHGNPTFDIVEPDSHPWPSPAQLAKAYGNPTFNEPLPGPLPATNDELP